MLGKTYDAEVCSIARALEVVGERWSLLIIRNALFNGLTRFGDFQRRLGIATNVLATRLDGFVDAGIMQRSDGSEYVLTDKGRDLCGVLVALTDWGDRCMIQPVTVSASRGPGMPAEHVRAAP
jgi:DNA-binding HxlR family transcriptional regulator